MKRSRKTRSRAPASASHEEVTVGSFQRSPKFAAEYLEAVLADGDQEELLSALRYMAKAFGGVRGLASATKLNSNTLYRTLSPKGNPELRSLRSVLTAMGLRLSVQPIVSTPR